MSKQDQPNIFAEFNKTANLPLLLEEHGFVIRKNESKPKLNKFTYERFHNGNKEKELIVYPAKDNSGTWVYFNRHDDNDSGSSTNFLYNEYNNDWSKVIHAINGYRPDLRAAANKPRHIQSEYKSEQFFKDQCYPLTKTNYLTDRGFSQRLINYLKPSIFNDKKGKILFPLFNEKTEWVGLFEHDYKTVFNAKGKKNITFSNNSEGFWYHLPKHKITQWILGESPEDVASAFSLRHEKMGFSTGLIATNGSFGESKLDHIARFINNKSDQAIIPLIYTAFDRDISGYNNDLKIACNMKLNRIKNIFNIKSSNTSKGRLQTRIEPIKEDYDLTALKSFLEHYHPSISQNIIIDTDKKFLDMDCQSTPQTNSELVNFISSVRYFNQQFILLKSNSKDHNKDLMNIRGIPESKLIKNDPAFFNKLIVDLNHQLKSVTSKSEQQEINEKIQFFTDNHNKLNKKLKALKNER